MFSIAVTSVPLPGKLDLWRVARANMDWLGTLLVGASIVNWRDQLVTAFTAGGWDLSAFYGAIFNWASFQGAFLFGVYAFFLSRSEPFIQAIAQTNAFQSLRRYVVRTLYLSLTLSVVTLPLVVTKTQFQTGILGWRFFAFLLVSVVVTYTFLCFLKVIRVFGKIERRN